MKYTFKFDIDVNKTPDEIAKFISKCGNNINNAVSCDIEYIGKLADIIGNYIGEHDLSISNTMLVPTDIFESIYSDCTKRIYKGDIDD